MDPTQRPFEESIIYAENFLQSEMFQLDIQHNVPAGTLCRWSSSLLAGEVVHRHRVLEERIVARHHGDAAVGDEVARAVGFGVVADGRALRQVDVAVDDAAADAAMA